MGYLCLSGTRLTMSIANQGTEGKYHQLEPGLRIVQTTGYSQRNSIAQVAPHLSTDHAILMLIIIMQEQILIYIKET